jgi:hypothetical protein
MGPSRGGQAVDVVRNSHPARSDDEIRSLLQVLEASGGVCDDALLRGELLDTGFVRRDAAESHLLHLTPEGRVFLHQAS